MPKFPLTIALTLSLLMSGCTAASADSLAQMNAAPSAPFRAIGHEPEWNVTLADGTIDFIGDYGETKIRQIAPIATMENHTQFYRTPRLTLAVEPQTCTDMMVEQSYSHKVTVTADGKTLTGCGGDVLPPASLDGSTWQIVKIQGQATLPDVAANLQFDGERVHGTAGCNRLMGGFKQEDAVLGFTNIATTRRACSGPLMQQESALIAALSQVSRHSFLPNGDLLLRSDSETLVQLSRQF